MADIAMISLAVAARQIGTDERPLSYVSLARAAQRLGILNYDSRGRGVISEQAVEHLRKCYRATGYLAPRRGLRAPQQATG
jgi:hypothetical protein